METYLGEIYFYVMSGPVTVTISAESPYGDYFIFTVK